MAKNRKKKRRKRHAQASVPPPPRPSRARNRRAAETQPDTIGASGTAEPPRTHQVGDAVFGTVVYVGPDGVLLADEDTFGWIASDDLPLADGQTPSDRYAIGDPVEALQTHVEQIDLEEWQVTTDARFMGATAKRHTPDYLKVLAGYRIGEVVSGTVAVVGPDSIVLTIGGILGGIPSDELPLADGQTPSDRYAVGDPVEALVRGIDRESRALQLSIPHNPSSYADYSVGDVVSGTVIDIKPDGVGLTVGGVLGSIPSGELPLAGGETPSDRYAIGDSVEAFVWQIRDGRHLGLSVRRNAPGYPDALAAHSVGDVVSGVVTHVKSDGIWLNVGGIHGSATLTELPLADGQTPSDRYAVDDPVEASITGISQESRSLTFSVRRNTASYIEALSGYSVGEVVSGTVTYVGPDGLVLTIGGILGEIPSDELSLADGQTPSERYAIDDPVEAFVWQIDTQQRSLVLSVRRNDPAYAYALASHTVGTVVSGHVTHVSPGGIWLNVDGVYGWINSDELSLVDGQTPSDHYAIGDPVEALLWQIDTYRRDLRLSIRRNTSGYRAAFDAITVSDTHVGIVTEVNEWGTWLDVAGIIGWIPARELELEEGQSPSTHYPTGNPIEARVWQIDQLSRTAILSVRRLATDFPEGPVEEGATIDADVQDYVPGGLRVRTDYRDIRVPHCELSLHPGDRPRFEYGQGIGVVVLAVDDDGWPTALSHRRTLANWQAEAERLAPGVIVRDAQVIPVRVLPPGENRLGVDLGPITGFVDRAEIGVDRARWMMEDSPNERYSVVVEKIEVGSGALIVSNKRFGERWLELAENISVGESMPVELRRVTRDKAILDLGSGLQAVMPREQIPTIEDAGERRRAREGEVFPVLITSKDETKHIIMTEHPNQWLVEMIAADENLKCEFKAVYRGSKGKSDVKTRSGLPVLQAMAGMMNRDGGYVLVGIEDPDKKEGEVIGWQASGFPNQNRLTTVLGQDVKEYMLTPKAADFYRPSFKVLPTGQEVLAIKCTPATVPVYIKNKLNKRYEFPLRLDASTQVAWPLDEEEQMRDLRRHFADRWPDEDPEALWNDFQRRARTRPSEDQQQSG